MIVVTFKSAEGDYTTEAYQTAEDLRTAIYRDYVTEAIVGVWQVD